MFNSTRLTFPLLACFFLATADPVHRAFAQDRWADNSSRTREQVGFSNMWQGSDWLGGGAARLSDWRLGVTGDNTDSGVRIRSVEPNSAAARARIEIGDTIINVDGYQVGMLNGRVFDLAREINRRASSSGAVGLLIQDHLSGRIASVNVQLDSNRSVVRGELRFQNSRTIPSNALVTVEIENVTRPYYVVRNGQQTFSLAGLRGNSVPFEIAYDETYINAQDVYRVRASVSAGGRTLLYSPSPANVITQGSGNVVQLDLVDLNNLAGVGGTGGVITAGYPNFNNISERITAYYRDYLGRPPTTLELAALRQTPGIETRIDTLPIELMAAQEYFDLVGNNNLIWLETVFQKVLGRKPTARELDQWNQRYAELRFSRTELLRQLNAQAARR